MKALPLLALLACGPVHVSGASQEALDIVSRLYPVEKGESASIVVTGEQPGDGAVADARQSGCPRVVRHPAGGARAEAHEIGHTFGLEHVKDRNNYMDPTFFDGEWTDKQRRRAKREARRLKVCEVLRIAHE